MGRISHLLNRTVSLRRVTQVSDGQGGFTESESEVATPKGRRHAARGNERMTAGTEQAEVTHIWYFEQAADVRQRDVIRHGGVDYEVLEVLPPSLDDFIKVETKEIQTGG